MVNIIEHVAAREQLFTSRGSGCEQIANLLESFTVGYEVGSRLDLDRQGSSSAIQVVLLKLYLNLSFKNILVYNMIGEVQHLPAS